MSLATILKIVIPALLVLLGKFVPNAKIRTFGKGIGAVVTLGAARWVPKWNKSVEPFIIDQIDHFIGGFFDGLRSDKNES